MADWCPPCFIDKHEFRLEQTRHYIFVKCQTSDISSFGGEAGTTFD